MNSLERVRATIAFARPDRAPVIPQIFAHAAVLCGVPVADYLSDGALLARCQIEALRQYGHDAVFAFMDASVESEALGSVLEYAGQQYPHVVSYALSADVRVESLSVPDLQRAGRIPELLRSATLLRAELEGGVPVVGVVLGPMTLVQQLMGPETALYLAVDEPQRFEALLDFATRIALRLGGALLDAGADVAMVFDPAASPAVVPPAFFRELLLPRLGRLFSAFKKAGALATWLHVAGPTEPILGYYPQAGVDIANLDYDVDPGRAGQLLARTCLDGNVLPLSFVLGSAHEIAAEGRRLVELFADRGGFILSSGCEIPPEARPENVAALVSAVHGTS
jgi:uroporphyrinogen decarboxylase